MSVARLDRTATPAHPQIAHNARTLRLLEGSIVPTLLRMAWPNVLVMVAQAATGLIETYFVAKLGTDALAGMALVFPCVMLMQMISAGAMGGGISSAIARALGAGRREEADALVLHAVVINVALGAFFSVIMLGFGAPIYRALGGQGGELKAALTYSNVVFAGNVLVWLMNGLANVIRGTGNMLMPALVTVIGVVFLDPAVSVSHLRHRAVSRARHRRRRCGGGAVQCGRRHGTRVVRSLRQKSCEAALEPSALAPVPQYS